MKIIPVSLSTPLLLLASCLLSGCGEKNELDRRMNELCKKDGGIKIYETVKLPPEMFDQSGSVRTSTVKQNGQYVTIMAEKYIWREEDKILKQGDPLKGQGQLSRVYSSVSRIDDGTVLAEGVQYRRAGGDGFYIGHHTQAVCPGEPLDLGQIAFTKK